MKKDDFVPIICENCEPILPARGYHSVAVLNFEDARKIFSWMSSVDTIFCLKEDMTYGICRDVAECAEFYKIKPN